MVERGLRSVCAGYRAVDPCRLRWQQRQPQPVWKYRLQKQLCDIYDLTITVCHYPPGASKWNPIEHRVFSEISKNWAGEPLDSFQTVLYYMRTTKTDSGLQVEARFVRKKYPTGEKVPQADMDPLCLTRHDILPARNYTQAPCPAEV